MCDNELDRQMLVQAGLIDPDGSNLAMAEEPSKDLFDDIAKALPPFFTRAKAVECLNGLFTLNSINHATTRPDGPPVHHIGRKVVLRRDEFIAWLRQYNGRLYGDIEGTGRGVRRPPYQENGTGTPSGRNQERKGSRAKEPNPLGDVFAGLEDGEL